MVRRRVILIEIGEKRPRPMFPGAIATPFQYPLHMTLPPRYDIAMNLLRIYLLNGQMDQYIPFHCRISTIALPQARSKVYLSYSRSPQKLRCRLPIPHALLMISRAFFFPKSLHSSYFPFMLHHSCIILCVRGLLADPCLAVCTPTQKGCPLFP